MAVSMQAKRRAIRADATPDDITDEMMAQTDAIIAGYLNKPGSLIPVLQKTQGVCGYLPLYTFSNTWRMVWDFRAAPFLE